MPLFMDVHEIAGGFAMDDVAKMPYTGG